MRQLERFDEKFDHGCARPCEERLLPVKTRFGELRQNCCDGAGIPSVIMGGGADDAFDVEPFARRLLGAHRYPTENRFGDDPADLPVIELADRHVFIDGGVFASRELAHTGDGGGGCPPLPFVFPFR